MAYLKEVRESRELLINLTMREVRGQYKRTFLGQLWSFANPLAQMVIYTFVFAFIFKAQPAPGNPSGLHIFALWLMAGLLPWGFFVTVINNSMGSIVGNAGLVQKVYFPRIVLPLSSAGSAAYNWVFEMSVLVVALLFFGSFVIPWLPLVVFFMAVLLIFASGLGMALSIANVYFRDTKHFVGIILNFWLFLTPIMYPLSMFETLSNQVGPLFGTQITMLDIYRLNPMERFTEVFRCLLYDNRFPTLSDTTFVIVAAALSFALGMLVFAKNERGLAEEL